MKRAFMWYLMRFRADVLPHLGVRFCPGVLSRAALSLLAVLLLCAGVRADEEGETVSYRKVYECPENHFEDVSPESWYAEYVRVAYEYGIMSGISSTRFFAAGQLTRGQALAIACRLHSGRTGKPLEVETANPWYQPYMEYALRNHLISAVYENLFSPITRSGFVVLLASSLPRECLPPISEIEDGAIPDVPSDAGCYDAVYLLYRAGILTGSGPEGRFSPYACISRGAAAAVVSRMAEPSLRVSMTLSSGGNTELPENGNAEPSERGDTELSENRTALEDVEDGVSAGDSMIPVTADAEAAECMTTPEGAEASEGIEASESARASEGTESAASPAVQSGADAEPVKAKQPFQPVRLENLANLSILGISGTDRKAAYEAAVKLVRPLGGGELPAMLQDLYRVLRDRFDSGLMRFSETEPHGADACGFFLTGVTSDAGCASATGLCLSILGIPWEPAGETTPGGHRWCRVRVGNAFWICDPYGFCCEEEPAPYVHPWLN